MTPDAIDRYLARWTGDLARNGRSSEDEDLVRIPADGMPVVAHVRPRIAAAILLRNPGAVQSARETVHDGRIVSVRLELDPEHVRSAELIVSVPRELSAEQRAAAGARLAVHRARAADKAEHAAEVAHRAADALRLAQGGR